MPLLHRRIKPFAFVMQTCSRREKEQLHVRFWTSYNTLLFRLTTSKMQIVSQFYEFFEFIILFEKMIQNKTKWPRIPLDPTWSLSTAKISVVIRPFLRSRNFICRQFALNRKKDDINTQFDAGSILKLNGICSTKRLRSDDSLRISIFLSLDSLLLLNISGACQNFIYCNRLRIFCQNASGCDQDITLTVPAHFAYSQNTFNKNCCTCVSW